MKRFRWILVVLVCAGIFGIVGCGGDNHGGELAESGWVYLLQLGESDDLAGSIENASAVFNQQLADDPDNPDPALGDAICDLLGVLIEIEGEFRGAVPASLQTARAKGGPEPMRLVDYGDIFRLHDRFSSGSRAISGGISTFVNPEVIAMLYLLTAGLEGADAEALRQAIHDTYVPQLLEIVDRIVEIGEANPGVIAVAEYEDTRYDIDQGDVLLLGGIVREVIALIGMWSCYSWDRGEWIAPEEFIDLDANDDNKITPAEFLPDEPYLTLVEDNFADLGDSIKGGVTEMIAGLQSTLDEEDEQTYDIIPNDDPDVQELLQAFIEILGSVNNAMEGPVDITINEVTTKINIKAWLDDAPDFRAIAPTFTIEGDEIDIYYDDLPDKTLDGLFPDGMPEEWWDTI